MRFCEWEAGVYVPGERGAVLCIIGSGGNWKVVLREGGDSYKNGFSGYVLTINKLFHIIKRYRAEDTNRKSEKTIAKGQTVCSWRCSRPRTGTDKGIAGYDAAAAAFCVETEALEREVTDV